MRLPRLNVLLLTLTCAAVGLLQSQSSPGHEKPPQASQDFALVSRLELPDPSGQNGTGSLPTKPDRKDQPPGKHSTPDRKDQSPDKHSTPDRKDQSPDKHSTPDRKDQSPGKHSAPDRKDQSPGKRSAHSRKDRFPDEDSASPDSVGNPRRRIGCQITCSNDATPAFRCNSREQDAACCARARTSACKEPSVFKEGICGAAVCLVEKPPNDWPH